MGSDVYDANGNMTYDPYKDMQISYNHLNLPENIVLPGLTIVNYYAATGEKLLEKKITSGGTITRTYVGGLEYLGSNLDAYYHASARLYYGGTATPEYQYAVRDHLGNTRIMFADKDNDGIIEETAGEVLQEHHYYPFGFELNGPWNSYGAGDSRYRYNGKELNEELGLYDYGARWYDPAVGRWTSVDPLAQKYSHLSPYNYVNNNPVLLIDPDGREFVNPYSDFSQYSGQRQELQDAVNSAKESGEKSALKSARKALRNFDRSGEGRGLSAYNEVEGILSSFKEAVGEDIYNHFDNLTFQGSDIDIVVNLSSQNNDSGDNQDAQTVIPYSVGQSTDFTTGKTSYYATGITDNTINITLFATGRDLSSFANEMGDVKFGTERSQAVLDDRNLPYDDQRSTQYSRAYEWWVTHPKSGGEPKVNEY